MNWLDVTVRIIQAPASLGTAVVAIVIFFQVRKIRQIEWLSKANESWNVFNNSLIAHGTVALFESFVNGRPVAEHDRQRLQTVIFSYLNIIYTTAIAKKNGLVLDEFANSMLETHFAILRQQEHFVRPLLEHRGYAPFFEKDIFDGAPSQQIDNQEHKRA